MQTYFGQKLRWEHSFKAYKLGPPHHFCEAPVSFLIFVSLTTTSLIVILWSGKSLEHRKPISNIGARKLLQELKEPCGSWSSTMSFKELFGSTDSNVNANDLKLQTLQAGNANELILFPFTLPLNQPNTI
jgi:hypothetical protein